MPVFTRLRQQPDTDDTATEGASPEVEPEARVTLRARLAGWRANHPAVVRGVRWTVTVLAAVLVLGALLLPNKESALHLRTFARIPVEALLGAAVALTLPRRTPPPPRSAACAAA